jgi:2-pyrone-4,6-dicarboxylate lactonase
MLGTPPPPVPNPHAPRLVTPPPGSCDTHCHVFGPTDRFPYAPDANYEPQQAPIEALERLWDLLGFQRAVIVQSTVHGTDHRAAADALRRGEGRYRGVAIIRPDTPDDEVARLHDQGFRGARLHFMPQLGTTPPNRDQVDAVVSKVRRYDWHVSLHMSGTTIVELRDMIRSIPGRVVIDHMARVDLSGGLDTEPVDTLMRLLENDNIWVKLSGADRLASKPPAMTDSVELARRLAEHVPDRVVWGTDYPHPNTHGFMADDGDLVDNLAAIAPTPQALKRILVDNPTALFDFDS